jgi:predicted anti-sigma-YlaC factor YlaD
MLSCEDLRAELSNLLDDDVPHDVRRALEHHLSECSTCRVLYDSTRKTVRIVTDAGAWEVPAAVSERLAARILAALEETN